MTPKKTKWLDVASMGLSSLCVVHCLALPFLVAALPFLGIFSQNELVHQILVSIAAPLSALALWRSGGWRRWDVVAPMTVGLLMLLSEHFSRKPLHTFWNALYGKRWFQSLLRACS
ncbi:MAG: MerC domain-containing protein [Asticcacaulis sp.]|nr:MerC domain-containing protein [Asticcacaulis sp.]